MDNLLAFLHFTYPLPPELRQHLVSILKYREFSRKEYLLRQGQISRNIYFIEKGLVRSFYMLGDKDTTAWFMKEGDVVLSIHSFFGQLPSEECIVALEDTAAYYVSFDELEDMYERFVCFNVHGRKVLTHYYQLSEQRAISMRSMKARERYDALMDQEPWILQRVPRKYIASYLGVTEATFSNIGSTQRKRENHFSLNHP